VAEGRGDGHSAMKSGRYYLPYNPKLVPRAKELRKNMTPAEKQLWFAYLKGLSIRFWPQRPIDNFIVDFYCPKLRLVIEIDGDSHNTQEAKAYDEERSAVLKGYGISVIRFSNQDVFQHFEAVCGRIDALIAELY
jgi:very-short-patch-repair endonuclease